MKSLAKENAGIDFEVRPDLVGGIEVGRERAQDRVERGGLPDDSPRFRWRPVGAKS